MMTKNGITVSRWIDGVLEKNELIDQDSNLRGVFYWGHAPTRRPVASEMKRAMDKLDLLVVVDPPIGHRCHGRHARQARRPEPQPCGVPAACSHAVRNQRFLHGVNRSLQWREKVIEPLWGSRSDHMIMYQLAQKLGFDKSWSRTTRCRRSRAWTSPWSKTSLREINRSVWTIGYTARAQSA